MFETVEMTEEYAAEISKWSYPSPYEIYSLKGDQEEIDQLMNGLHMAVIEKGHPVGFIAFGWAAQVVCDESRDMYQDESLSDIAFGLKPELCGQGRGGELIRQGIEFIKEIFPEDGIRLTVREDNHRAIRAYEKEGFSEVQSFTQKQDKYLVMCYNK